MSWRIWIFRSLVCVIFAAIGTAGWLTYLQTNSEAVRAKVIEQIQADFPGVDVQIGSAWVRPLGGLWLRDVRLARREDPGHPFLIVPSATVYHDKEQLAQGRLVIRKVELVQPAIRLRRDADGNWNVPSLPRSAGRVQGPVPMLIVRQGTVSCEDRSGAVVRPVLEFNDVQLTLMNDPLPKLTLHGQAKSVLGVVKWSGTHERTTNLSTVTFEAPTCAFTPKVIEQLGGHVSELRQHLAGLEGQGDARLEVRYQGGPQPSFRPDLLVHLHEGRFRHPRLPLSPLQDIELTARYRDGQLTVEKGHARSGSTRVTLDLEAALPLDGPRPVDPEQILSRFNLSIEHLTLSSELFEQLPQNLKRIHENFKPSGPVGLTFKIEKRDRWWSKRCIVTPEGLTAQYVDFPYVLRDIHGQLEQLTTSDGKDELQIRLSGQASGCSVVIEGVSAGSEEQSRLDLKIHGRGLPVDENLKRALGANRSVADAFHPVGQGDFVARMRRNPGDPFTDTHIEIDFRKLAICYEAFPYPLDDVSGTLRIHLGPETKITFDEFQATHGGGELGVKGTHQITPSGAMLRLQVRAAGLPFDSDLRTAFAKVGLEPMLKTMRPSGRLKFDGELTSVDWIAPPGARKPPGRREVVCQQFTVESILPDFLPYELTNVSGAFHFADDKVTLTEFQARHHASQLRIGGRDAPSVCILKAGGGIWARLQKLQLAPLVLDDDLLSALPPQMRRACTALEASGPMSLAVEEFIIDSTADRMEPAGSDIAQRPVRGARMSAAPARDESSSWMYWRSATIRFSGAALKLGLNCDNVHGEICTEGAYRHGRLGAIKGNLRVDQANIRRQPIQDVHAQLVLDPAKAPGVLQFKFLKARMFGGDLAGEVALALEPVLRYDVRLIALNLRLEDIDRHNKFTTDGQLSGRAQVSLYLSGQGGDLKSLRGGGTFHVPQGHIYNLPPLLDLLKVARLRPPDGTFFEEAFARFRIQGETVTFDQIDLTGNLISLTGDGSMKLDGSNLRLDIYTVWSKLVQALPGVARDVPNAISRSLYKIELRGALGGPLEGRPEAVPVLVEPVKRLLERFNGINR